MSNEEAIKVLEDIKLFAAAEQLDALNYAIDVLSNVDKKGENK